MSQKQALGKGLSSLLGENSSLEDLSSNHFEIELTKLKPSRYQPRTHFDEDELVSLSSSIRSHGILQPILVKPDEDGSYQIIAGERRWRAAKLAELTVVPVVSMEISDLQAMEISLLENIQRQDLSPVEEADGYRKLLSNFNHTQESLSKVLGKSRSHIANMLRLLTLPDDIKAALEDGDLSVGHAKLLIGAEDPSLLAKHIIKNRLNVSESDTFIKEASPKKRSQSRPQYIDPEIANLTKQLEEMTGMKAEIRPYGDSRGKIVFDYFTLDQLDLFLHRLSVSSENVPYRTE